MTKQLVLSHNFDIGDVVWDTVNPGLSTVIGITYTIGCPGIGDGREYCRGNLVYWVNRGPFNGQRSQDNLHYPTIHTDGTPLPTTNEA